MNANLGDNMRHSSGVNVGKGSGIVGKAKLFAIANGGIMFLMRYL
jgi:hypothetical protein